MSHAGGAVEVQIADVGTGRVRSLSRFALTAPTWCSSRWQRLVFDGKGVEAITGSLLVLAAVAVVFTGAGAVLLRRELARG